MSCTMQDFRRFFSTTIAWRSLHRSIIVPKQRHHLTLLQKEQTALTAQRWLFAESVEHIIKKVGDTKKDKCLLSLSLSEHKAEQSPDFIVAGLRDIYQKRLTIQSHVFINSILIPLELKNGNLVKFLQRSGDTHVPFLLSLCGLPMSDATCSTKSALADRFWNALIHANIPITCAAMKSRLRILIENEQTFDALQMLKEAETTFGLEPDEELFTIILQELSVTGNISSVNSMIREIERRKLPMNIEMKASQIYCYFKNDDNDSMELVQNAITEYGNEMEPLIFMVRCQAAIEKCDIQNFKLLLDSFSPDLFLKSLTDEMAMKFVWLLARNGSDSTGKDHERLCTEILRKVRKERGFFKLMVREANRHSVHGMFYSALSYFHSDLHSSSRSLVGNGSDLGRHMDWVGCFSKALINTELPLEELKILFAHINRNTHNARFLLEHILYCVLTHKFLSVQKSLLLTLELLKILDPHCTKIHVVIPLLVRASGVEQRLEILTRFVSVGYSDLNHLNYSVVQKLVLLPLLGKDNAKRNKWNIEQLARIVSIFKEHNIPEDNAYKLLKPVVTGISNLEKWLKERNNRNETDARNSSEVFSSTLKKYISNQEVDKIHEFIKMNGSADSFELFQPIIMLYINKADWNILIEYIKQIHNDGNGLIHLTVDNVLLILARHLEEFKSFDMTSDFIYYLQQIVSKDLHSNTRNQKAMRRLIQQSLELPYETVQPLIACSQMFRRLADVKWIQSGFLETVSTSFASAALTKFGFEEALKVCSFFQFSDFPNGIICLLHYASRIGDENLTSKALALARTYWPEWKVSVTFASIMICLEKLEEANSLLQNANIRWINVFQTYKLLCALHLDETHNFHFNYLKFFSEALKYSRHDEACTRLALDCLRNCSRKDPDQAYLVKFFLKRH
uniref:Leucine-rich PPR motif-containing protein, mitochondrial n=1 Tax=Elaeophora elaphi TaxID=1147741 RepID=A0A0R3RSU8_9BILA